jgi:hypothetical protein
MIIPGMHLPSKVMGKVTSCFARLKFRVCAIRQAEGIRRKVGNAAPLHKTEGSECISLANASQQIDSRIRRKKLYLVCPTCFAGWDHASIKGPLTVIPGF